MATSASAQTASGSARWAMVPWKPQPGLFVGNLVLVVMSALERATAKAEIDGAAR